MNNVIKYHLFILICIYFILTHAMTNINIYFQNTRVNT